MPLSAAPVLPWPNPRWRQSRSKKIIRFGAEYDIDNVWTVRAEASYSTAVIPNQTITPFNAALAESVISAGAGYQQPDWHPGFFVAIAFAR